MGDDSESCLQHSDVGLEDKEVLKAEGAGPALALTTFTSPTRSAKKNKSVNVEQPLLKDPYACEEACSDISASETRKTFQQKHGVYSRPDGYKKLKRRCWKNVLVLAAVFFFLDLCFCSIRDMSSSINHQANLGVISLACTFGICIIANFVMVPFITKFGPKKCMIFGAICHVLFSASNMYPRTFTLVPGGLLIGIGRAFFMGPQAVYTTTLGIKYAKLTSEPSDVVIGRIAGFILIFPKIAPTIGAAVGSVVITQVTDDDSGIWTDIQNTGIYNKTFYSHRNNVSRYLRFYNQSQTRSPYRNTNQTSIACGADYCHSDGLAKSKGYIPKLTRYILMAIYCFCGIFALFLLSFLDDSSEQEAQNNESMKRQILAILHAMKDRKFMLLAPYLIYLGIEISFFYGDVVKAFVACTAGVGSISYFLIAFNGASAVGVFSGGGLQKYLGNNIIFGTVTIIQLSLFVLMLLWIPGDGDLHLLLLMSPVYGVADGLLTHQQQSFVGHLFQDNKGAAFAGLYTFRATGQMITFAIAPVVCMRWKICLTACVCVISTVGYIFVQVIIRSTNRTRE